MTQISYGNFMVLVTGQGEQSVYVEESLLFGGFSPLLWHLLSKRIKEDSEPAELPGKF